MRGTDGCVLASVGSLTLTHSGTKRRQYGEGYAQCVCIHHTTARRGVLPNIQKTTKKQKTISTYPNSTAPHVNAHVALNHDVLGLNISVQNVLCVQIRNCAHELLKNLGTDVFAVSVVCKGREAYDERCTGFTRASVFLHV